MSICSRFVHCRVLHVQHVVAPQFSTHPLLPGFFPAGGRKSMTANGFFQSLPGAEENESEMIKDVLYIYILHGMAII